MSRSISVQYQYRIQLQFLSIYHYHYIIMWHISYIILRKWLDGIWCELVYIFIQYGTVQPHGTAAAAEIKTRRNQNRFIRIELEKKNEEAILYSTVLIIYDTLFSLSYTFSRNQSNLLWISLLRSEASNRPSRACEKLKVVHTTTSSRGKWWEGPLSKSV